MTKTEFIARMRGQVASLPVQQQAGADIVLAELETANIGGRDWLAMAEAQTLLAPLGRGAKSGVLDRRAVVSMIRTGRLEARKQADTGLWRIDRASAEALLA